MNTHAFSNRRSAVLAWVLLDWAASGFSAISITLLVAYFDRIVFLDGYHGLPAGVLWAWTLAIAMLLSAFLAPVLSAWVDRNNAHQMAVVLSSAFGAAACMVLAMLPSSSRIGIPVAVILATVAFDIAAIFTASLLPRLAQDENADKLSSAGFAAGYAGGAIALILATTIVAEHHVLGLSLSDAFRFAFALMGVWWLAFTLPTAFVHMGNPTKVTHAGASGTELISFFKSMFCQTGENKSMASLGYLLLGVVTVLGAVQTAIPQFSNVAVETFHLNASQLVRLVLLVQCVALPGALVIGWLSTTRGRHFAAKVCLAGWSSVFALTWFIHTQTHLFVLAVFLALVLGGIQSVLRAMLAVAAPDGHHAATFGLMQVGTKLTGFTASLVFGWVYAATGIAKAGLLVLLVQLIFGWWLLSKTKAVSRMA